MTAPTPERAAMGAPSRADVAGVAIFVAVFVTLVWGPWIVAAARVAL